MLVVESAALETVYNIFNKDTGFIFMNKSILVNRTTLKVKLVKMSIPLIGARLFLLVSGLYGKETHFVILPCLQNLSLHCSVTQKYPGPMNQL